MDPNFDTGEFGNFTGRDLIAFDVIGWDLAIDDRFEANNTIGSATVLGSAPAILVSDLTIGIGDVDVFKYTANSTGKLIVNTLFDHENGDIDLRIRDMSGDLIASSLSFDDDETIIIPVVAQQMYFIEVVGFPNFAVNEYSLEIENFPAPVPTGVHLDPLSDTGMMNNDNITSDTTPTIFIQTDVLTFVDTNDSGLFEQGSDAITALNPGSDGAFGDALNETGEDNQDAGIAIQVTFVNTTNPLAPPVIGFAEPIPDAAPEVYRFTPSTALAPGRYLISARSRVFDGATPQRSGLGAVSPPLWITIEGENAGVVGTIDLLASSDSGMFNDDNVTNKWEPTFTGFGPANAKVHLFAQGTNAAGAPVGTPQIVATGVVGSDLSDGVDETPPNERGIWQLTSAPLVEGKWLFTARFETAAGQLSDPVGLVANLTTLVNGGIPDGGSVNSPRIVTAADFPGSMGNAANMFVPVSDVEVTVNINHPLDADLDISLISPTGVVIDLSSDNGADGDNYTNTVFDDAAATAITAGTAPFTGRFRPEVALSGLNGLNALGSWTLRVADDLALDVGTLIDWTLRIVTPLMVVIDKTEPNTPLLDLNSASDTGRNGVDNITLQNTPIVTMTTTDPNIALAQLLFTDNLKFRIFDRFVDFAGGAVTEFLIYDSTLDAAEEAISLAGDMFTSQTIITETLAAQFLSRVLGGTATANAAVVNSAGVGRLADGIHNFKLEVEDRAGNISHDFLLPVEVDTVTPPVSFGDPTIAADGLKADSDTGVLADTSTLNDRITKDSTPTFWGIAEADSVVRVFADVNENGVVDAGDVLLGQAVATPLDGNRSFADGYWEITSSIDLNDPSIYDGLAGREGRDGLRKILVTAQDVAGNTNLPSDNTNDALAKLDIFLDTQGPQVNGVFVTGERTYDLFDPKPSTDGPTPLVNSIDIDLIDFPIRGEAGMAGGAGMIDVLLLFDDTGSFAGVAPTLISAFPSLITTLQASLAGADLAFGVARFEDYSTEAPDERPFVLNQPILSTSNPQFTAAINAALARSAPGGGGDTPESAIEGLFQAVTGAGFDGDGNGNTTGSGAAGLVSTQVTPGSTGDVPTFASFTADASGPVVAGSGTLGGVGFRAGATKLILLATDTGFVFQPDTSPTVTGAGGVVVSVSSLTDTSRGSTPGGRGATFQQTVDALLALDGGAGVRVIGLGTNSGATTDPREGLEALATLTGAVNTSTTPIDSGIVGDAIEQNEPMYFVINTSSATTVANAITQAITGSVGSTGFLYPAINELIATDPGQYSLIGDHVGRIAIQSIEFIDNTVAGQIGRSTVRLNFFEPLPDDRYTLTVEDVLVDDAGNNLDGESNAAEPQENPQFPSGNIIPGGDFVGRFTVDTRPEIGSFIKQNISIDTNGNFVWDPAGGGQIGGDATNRDIQYTLPVGVGAANAIGLGGYNEHDLLFAGKFSLRPGSALSDGFDTLAAYGYSNELNQRRWLVDRNHDGVVNVSQGDRFEPQADTVNFGGVVFNAVGAIPVAGNFVGGAGTDDEIGLYYQGRWAFDTNKNFRIDSADTLFVTNLLGHPIVGDFDGDGLDDLAVFNNNQFFFNFANNGLAGASEQVITWGYPGVLDRPVAADYDRDGIDDIGLWVPRNSSATPRPQAEWYILISNDAAGTRRVTGQATTLNHPFTPVPFGEDLYAEFGDELALPIFGNFDPPVASAPTGVAVAASLPGDYNRDGVVNGNDRAVWAGTFGSRTDLMADGNGNGVVDAGDYSIWADNRAPKPAMTAALASRTVQAGDYNADGRVGTEDVVLWRKAFGTTSRTADGNGDGVVDAADYSIARDKFGVTNAIASPAPMSPPAASITASVAVASAATSAPTTTAAVLVAPAPSTPVRLTASPARRGAFVTPAARDEALLLLSVKPITQREAAASDSDDCHRDEGEKEEAAIEWALAELAL